MKSGLTRLLLFLLLCGAWAGTALATDADSSGCMSCHQGIESMHGDGDGEIGISCVGCHGGNGTATTINAAHVQPNHKDLFSGTGNPPNNYAQLNKEKPEFVRFMNPGDFRVAGETCGQCHEEIYNRMLVSIMSHSSMVPQSGLYNNGIHPAKIPVFGEAYTRDGEPAVITLESEGVPGSSHVTKLEPLPNFEATPATDAFRVLERGNNDAGTRGPGTDFKIAGGGIVLHKTRLNDPTLWFLGVGASQGDYRSSGCTACHVMYANDREENNSGPIVAEFFANGGKYGHSASADPSIPKDEPGHPIRHEMSTSVPISQCLTCHHHQGNGALGNYVGSMWWDQESDADQILSPGARRDKFTDNEHRKQIWANNSKYDDVQIDDWHGHGWNYRRVYSRDRKGNLLDGNREIVAHDDPDKFKKAVHLADIHFEKGMHCIDCHTEQDVHGDNRMWGAMIDAIEIRCEDCHGTVTERPTLVTSGVAGSNDMGDRRTGARTPWGERQFERGRGGKIIQRSKIKPDLQWEIPQLVDIVDSSHASYNEKAARAKTLQTDGTTWGKPVDNEAQLAHKTADMECYTCHSAWNTNCYGCHLSADVNRKAEAIHYEGKDTLAYVQYNPMVLRADGYLMGINGTAKGNKFSPMRSASAVFVSVRDGGRNEVVHQQQTISASGHAGFAVTPNPPHTVRRVETKQCDDCHVSRANDNNAWLAVTLGMGANGVNFVGEYAWVAQGSDGMQAVKITEGVEPQPVIGSHYHALIEPESSGKFVRGGRKLDRAYSAGSKHANEIAARGEFVYVADGPAGLRVYDRADISRNDKAQRIVTMQNSALGQTTRMDTTDARSVALPSNLPMNPDRPQLAMNLETPVADIFRYAFVADYQEGLIVVDSTTFTDHEPRNNRIRRAATYNAEGRLAGAVKVHIAGNYAYVVSDQSGLNIIDVSNPTSPRWVAGVGAPDIEGGRSVGVQFRYAFVTDSQGLKVVNISEPDQPRTVASVPLSDARGVYVMRTYAYVAAGREGIAIIDVETPDKPKLVEKYSAGGVINDANGLTTTTVNASTFAVVADGANGLRVLSLIGPPDVPGHLGFSPAPRPELIATFQTRGTALSVAHGVPRDRSTDESGNQIGVGGRLGSHPMTKSDMDKLLRQNGKTFTVEN